MPTLEFAFHFDDPQATTPPDARLRQVENLNSGAAIICSKRTFRRSVKYIVRQKAAMWLHENPENPLKERTRSDLPQFCTFMIFPRVFDFMSR